MQTRRLIRACSAAFAIALASPAHAQDFWTALGFTADDIKGFAFSALAAGDFNAPSVPALRVMPATPRNTLIATAAAWAKRWSQTAEFSQRYAELRESRKPSPPEQPVTSAQRRANDRAEFAKVLAQLDSSLARSTDTREQAQLREMIQQVRKQVAAIDDPKNPAYGAEVDAMFAQQQASERDDYQAKLKEWEASFPPSPQAAIRLHLREFLALADSVDFSAKVEKNAYGRVTFVDEDYEAKPAAWKSLFRAGRETTSSLQAAARQWLTELK